ncbi:MAG: Gfo/Idh/MocA family oxidoreductase [Phycisphaerae bacterium]|nr:Gfo/Idh/MocA family oxidoreductase [Phycisphaerae bacterium]
MSRITRRQFVRGSMAAGLGIVMAGPLSRVRGANDEIRVGVVGVNGRGGSHISAFEEMEGVRVAALCDVDRKVLDSKAAAFEKKYTHKVETYIDIRKMLENKDLDAISIATPNHWHSLGTIWACQAGKDVYVEKPCSHNVFEGRKCVEAARKYKRIVQHGTQSRSSKGWAKQVAAIASGQYGKLLVSKGAASKGSATGRWSIGFKPIQDPPENLDYNLWLGPAPEQPFHENLVHYNWHWFWDFGNGEIGNQGVHQMDIARWAIPGATLPNRVISMGGRWVNSTEGHPPFTDQAQTPNCQLTIMDFGGTLLVFEVLGLVDRVGLDGKKYPNNVGNEFYLEAGVIRGGKFYPKDSDKAEELPNLDVKMGPGDHFENFIHAMRSRKIEDLNADIEEGYLSSACCQLGNISYRLGEQVAGSIKPDVLGKHEEIARSWERIAETAKGTIGFDLAQNTYQLGAMLTFAPKTEKFVGNPQADELLTRPYRAPFVVNQNV